jgi:hypothetical protein
LKHPNAPLSRAAQAAIPFRDLQRVYRASGYHTTVVCGGSAIPWPFPRIFLGARAFDQSTCDKRYSITSVGNCIFTAAIETSDNYMNNSQ